MPKLPFHRSGSQQVTPAQPTAQTPSVAARRKAEARTHLADFRSSGRLRLFIVGVVFLCLGAVIGTYFSPVMNSRLDKVKASEHSDVNQLNQRIDQFATSCAGKGTCKTFPFQAAEESANWYTQACFNYSANATANDQATRLKDAGGPDDCGWGGSGSGTATVLADSLARQPILTPDKQARSDLGIVGMKVQMVGQPDLLEYIVPVSSSGATVKVATAGAFYSSPPTTVIDKCVPDTSIQTSDIMSRLNSMEAGRTHAPNIDPNDYLVNNVHIATFGPSITAISVTSVQACRGSNATNATVVAREKFSGPVPGSSFTFVNGYTLTKDASNKWFVSGWGPVVESDLGNS